MPASAEPSRIAMSNESDARLRNVVPTRAFPRCEPAFMHYELGASQQGGRSTAEMAKRYTPQHGARKER